MPDLGPAARTADPAVHAALDAAARGLRVAEVVLRPARDDDTGTSTDRRRGVLRVPVPVTGSERLELVAVAPSGYTFVAADEALLTSTATVVATLLDRARVAQAQATLAAFGRFSLATRDVDLLLQSALDTVVEILDSRGGFVVRRAAAAGRATVVAVHGAVPVAPGDQPDDTDEHLEGAAGGVAAPPVPRVFELAAGPQLWGRLLVLEPGSRTPAEPELDAVRTVLAILGAALQGDATARRLHETARTLTEALLPARPPVVPGIEAAARYLPGDGERVGGDWYDVVPLAHGAVGLVVGHVDGDDVTAAVVMGQVRNAVRAYAADGLTPAEVVDRTHRFVLRHADRRATCCYLELHPSELTVTGVSAGNAWPLVVTPDGELPLSVPPGRALDPGAEPDHDEHTWMLPPGATLLFTAGPPPPEGPGATAARRAAAAIATELSGRSVEVVADALTAGGGGHGGSGTDGDGHGGGHGGSGTGGAALLVVRLLGTDLATGLDLATGTVVARRVFRPMPESVPAARRFVRDLLAGWHRSDLADAALLAVSELVTNAVIHTASPIVVTLRPGDDGLWVGVHDESDRFVVPRQAAEDDITGRGLAIVAVLADRWGVDTVPGRGGKTVWFELDAAPSPAQAETPAPAGAAQPEAAQS